MTTQLFTPIPTGGRVPFSALKKTFAVVFAPVGAPVPDQGQVRITVRLDIGAYHELRILSGELSMLELAVCMQAMLDEAQKNWPQIVLDLDRALPGDVADADAEPDDASHDDIAAE